MAARVPLSVYIVLFSVWVDFMSMFLSMPLIPQYVTDPEYLNTGVALMGVAYASFAGAQMIGAPITGMLSDSCGAKRMLCASLLGSMVGLALQGAATTFEVFVAGRVVGGLFGGELVACLSRRVASQTFALLQALRRSRLRTSARSSLPKNDLPGSSTFG